MIYVITGLVGSGKSYEACLLSIRHLLGGGVVATNMRLDPPAIQKIYHRKIADWQVLPLDARTSPAQIPHGDFRGTGTRRVMVVLDEALNWFESSRSLSSDDPRREWGVWLRQSDKLGQDVYFIAQSFQRAAKWIRELAQVRLNVVRFEQLQIGPIPIGKFLGVKRLNMVSIWDVPSNTFVGWRMRWINSSVWSCYRTAELYDFDPGRAAYVEDAPARVSWPRWTWYLPIIALLWGVYRCLRGVRV